MVHSPAKSVLNANLPESDTIYTFHSEVYGTIYLMAGREEDYGFRHILARHTSAYFINFDNKNDKTLFDNKVSGDDIVLGIKEFYKHCIDVGAYNMQRDNNIAYVGYTKLNGENVKCLLIVNKLNMGIITFYPFNEIREQEILKELEEQRELERRKFHFD